MNTSKIAALYANPILNTQLRFPSFDLSTTLTAQVMKHVMNEARKISEDGRAYSILASHVHRRQRPTNDLGERSGGFFDEDTSKRVADWVLSQMPNYPEQPFAHLRKGMAAEDEVVIQVWGHVRGNDDLEPRACLLYGAQEDFEVILRGMASIRRKRRKQAKKLEAQLRAYHTQQLANTAAAELAYLRSGHWLGADKALTTATRINEPSVPFMGDVNMTAEEQEKRLYWAVSQQAVGMVASFPAGTGVALKKVNRSRELINGAIYLYQEKITYSDGRTFIMSTLGRLDLSRKIHGMLPIFRDEAPEYQMACFASWSDKAINIYRVTHYTTRGAEPVAMQAETQLAPAQTKHKPKKQRELAHAA
ncbi:MAG: hypothetical protein ACRYFV_13785 [Janthinobacterium lividum]